MSTPFEERRVASSARVIVLFGCLFLGNSVAGQQPKVDLTPPQKEYAQKYHQPFTGMTANPRGWEVLNPGAESNVRFEAGGLRITLPPGQRGGHKATGVLSEFGVQGDFEVTVSFEIIKEADIGTDRTILDLIVTKDVEKSDVTTIGRLMSPKEGTRFIGWANLWDTEKAKMTPHSSSVPTKIMTGRLRLVRSGNDIHYGYSDGFEKDFRYFRKFPFGAEEIRRIRVVGANGGDQAMLDVRVTDFLLRADVIPNSPGGAAVAPGAEPVAARPANNFLVYSLVLGLGVIVLLALAAGAFLFLRKQTQNATPLATNVTVVCAGCNKTLKVTAEMAGKKVKCPHCGSIAPVPKADAIRVGQA